MKSSPIKYSFVRFANWLICFWFNIMIIHKSSLSSISNSVSISQGMSWRTHGMASAVNVLTVSLIMGVVSTSGCCDHRPVCLIWWLSADGSVPLSESSSSNSHKCVIITGLDCVNISNVLHISAFKLWLCVCCKGIVVNKMNLKHHRMLLPLTADTPDTRLRVSSSRLNIPSPRGDVVTSTGVVMMVITHDGERGISQIFHNSQQQSDITDMTWGLSKLKLSFIETRMSWGEATSVVWIISRI